MLKQRVLLPAVLALACSSCSFIFVHPPHHANDQLVGTPGGRCTSSKVAPVLDTLVTGFQVVRTGLAVSADDSTYQGAPISRGADVGFGIGFATLFLSSAIYGFYETGQCHAPKAPHGSADEEPASISVAPLDPHSRTGGPAPVSRPRRPSPEEP